MHRHRGDNLAALINDYDLVTHDEVLMAAPSRIDLDQRRRHSDEAHRTRHNRAHAEREVDVIDARDVRAGEHRLANVGLLLRRQIDSASLAGRSPSLSLDTSLAGLHLLRLLSLTSRSL